MSIKKQFKPNLSHVQVIEITARLYGLTLTSIKPLPSYDDQNFHVGDKAGKEFVLKIMNSSDSKNLDVLELQTYCMNFLQKNGLPAQFPVRNLNGKMMSLETIDCGFGEQKYLVRLLMFLPGIPIAKIACTSQLLYQTGKMAATVDQVLMRMEHNNLQVLQRDNFIWSLFSIPLLEQYLHVMDGDPIQPVVKGVLQQYHLQIKPRIPFFRKCVNHGDLNDHNILVEGDEDCGYRISGILDFGDMNSGCLVFELAIVIMYMMIESTSPLAVAGPLLAGWESVFPLNQDERDALYLLVLSRFCQSLLLARHAVTQQPENREYLMTTAKTGIRHLQLLWEKGQEEVQRIWFQDAAQITMLNGEAK